MAENTNTDAGMGITGAAPLYQRPEPLNPEAHGALGVDMRQNPYGFAAKQHFVPLVAGEFPQACTVYPIIFAGDDLIPLAVMCLAEEENFFFHEAGDEQGEGKVLANIGVAKHRAGQTEEARKLLLEALAKLRPDSDAHRRVERRLARAI